MRTLTEAILEYFEISKKDARYTVKEIVLMEDDRAKCVKTAKGFSIRSGATRLGYASAKYGSAEDAAWEDAALRMLLIKV